MEGFGRVIQKLRLNSIEGEVWVDGSFVTEKINPADVDLILRCSADFFENGTQQQRRTVEWLKTDLKSSHLCDAYCLIEWPEDHQNYWVGEYMHNYWMRQFGFSRGNAMKGIAVIALPRST